MAQLLSPDRMHQIARLMDRPELLARRPAPTMVWSIDATTGRPVANWVMLDEQDAPTT